jgi:hypothetical protein
LGNHFHIAPDGIGYHLDLEKGLIVFEFGGDDHIRAFTLGFTDQIFDFQPLIVFGNDVVGFACQIRTKDP